jgi:glycosyltransferase involved in cell wall biosynthesis
VAKDIYVGARTGWFSDRSVCYLAAGRPVITQETGFSKFVPTGSGLFPFSSLDEVREAIARINADYQSECLAAREVAWEAFDADQVLRAMMKRAGM